MSFFFFFKDSLRWEPRIFSLSNLSRGRNAVWEEVKKKKSILEFLKLWKLMQSVSMKFIFPLWQMEFFFSLVVEIGNSIFLVFSSVFLCWYINAGGYSIS